MNEILLDFEGRVLVASVVAFLYIYNLFVFISLLLIICANQSKTKDETYLSRVDLRLDVQEAVIPKKLAFLVKKQ